MDPMKEGVLKLSNTANCGRGKAGGIAAYNLTQASQTYSFSPEDVQGLAGDKIYLTCGCFRRTIQLCNGKDRVTAELEAGSFAWHQILPFEGEAVFLGLTEKYAGFSAVEDMFLGDLKKVKVSFKGYKATGEEVLQWPFCSSFDCGSLVRNRTEGFHICGFVFNHACALYPKLPYFVTL